MKSPFLTLFLTLYSFALAVPDAARADSICDQMADQAALQTDVPPALLRAITRVETGRDGEPWPWTLNIDGQGYWFDSQEQAVAAAETALADGADQIDLGCFQLNLRWHGAAFADLSAMLDPAANAAYAARFLSDLHAESGDWRVAAAAYHSRTPDKGDDYVAALEAAHQATTPVDASTPEDAATRPPRPNHFPLLLAGEVGINGSLVPVTQGVTPLIGAP